jgi:hypothetical protein
LILAMLLTVSTRYSRVHPCGVHKSIQPVRIRAGISIGYDLSTFPVVCCVRHPPLDLIAENGTSNSLRIDWTSRIEAFIGNGSSGLARLLLEMVRGNS